MNVSSSLRSRVQLVDGDASLRRALARALRLAGFEVESFASVHALLVSGSTEQAGCLVLDVDTPGVGGIRYKQALMAAGRDRPTVFMTASERDGLDAELARLDPVAVLYKPFSKDELLRALRRAIADQRTST